MFTTFQPNAFQNNAFQIVVAPVGPITINTGIIVTVSTGSRWVVV
jgi:hypothetical protein